MNKQTESNNSQTIITQPDISPNNINHILCNICQNYYDQTQMNIFGKCMHLFCYQCSQLYIDSQIREERLVKCPQENCCIILNQESLLITSLPQQKQRKYYKIQKRCKNPNIAFCSLRDCLGELTLNPKLSNCFGILNCAKGVLQCNACSGPHCSNCYLSSHSGPCPITDKSADHEMVKNLQQNYLFKRCRRCNMVVQKNEGCDHITCKCRFQFCYTCGRDYSVHTCTFIKDHHDHIIKRILWTFFYLVLLVALFPVDIALTVILILTPITALAVIIPLALILGFVKMKQARCHVILMGNIFLYIACFFHSIPKAFSWYSQKAIPMWTEALRYCHFTFFCLKITRILLYRLPVTCNDRQVVTPLIEKPIIV